MLKMQTASEIRNKKDTRELIFQRYQYLLLCLTFVTYILLLLNELNELEEDNPCRKLLLAVISGGADYPKLKKNGYTTISTT